MKQILMIGTGGTIASGKTAEGLMPELTSEQLLAFVPAVSALCRVECLQLLSLDSTNLGPAHWLQIAGAIRARYDRYDGFVISHGTDTMAYTAAALSYLIQDAAKPIILTGAQKPISFDSTDSKVNLTDAFLCACSDTLHGVMIVFKGHPGHARVQDALKELRGLFQHQLSVSGRAAGRVHPAVYRKRLPAGAGLL